jgi:hypothetical protein
LTLVQDPKAVVTVLYKLSLNLILMLFCIIRFILIIHIIVQATALLKTLEFQESVQSKGHFARYNCLVLGHTKYNGNLRVYCNPFPAKPFHSSHRLDIVMIRPPGIDNGAFVVSPDNVWYARVLLLFLANALTDTGSKSFKCTLISTLETYDYPENGNYINYLVLQLLYILY